MSEICLCGHPYERHTSWKGHAKYYDSGTCWECNMPKRYHLFKLDNLRYVEKLAKEKGLV